MIDAKAIAEAMDFIIERLTKAHGMTLFSTGDDPDVDKMKIATELGSAIGAANAVKLQCERASKPTMRGAAE